MLAYLSIIERPVQQVDVLQRAEWDYVHQKSKTTAVATRDCVGGGMLKLDTKHVRHIKSLPRGLKTGVTWFTHYCGVLRTRIYEHCGVSWKRGMGAQ